jgi:[acyl-carrier-protein] S-malonyltransferase
MTRLVVFPGQGSQHMGMGKELAAHFRAARDVFDQVDEALGQSLFQLMTDGDEALLNQTENTQPALLAVSLAIVTVLREEYGLDHLGSLYAGHSLGEYSALTAAGVLDLATAVRLVKKRGEAMTRAVPKGKGSMAAVLGGDPQKVKQLCAEQGVWVANWNCPGQVVISGDAKAIEFCIKGAKAYGFKRIIGLNVSGPFHSPLMIAAAEDMVDYMNDIDFHAPHTPIVTNVSGTISTDPAVLKDRLIQQITGQVAWEQSLHLAAEEGIDSQIEIGSGAVLTGLAKKTYPDWTRTTLHTPADIETFMTEA